MWDREGSWRQVSEKHAAGGGHSSYIFCVATSYSETGVCKKSLSENVSPRRYRVTTAWTATSVTEDTNLVTVYDMAPFLHVRKLWVNNCEHAVQHIIAHDEHNFILINIHFLSTI